VPNRPRAEDGTTFHVVNRATRGELLYRDFGEYLSYLRLLSCVLRQWPVDVFAFCLMPNHFHFLIRPETHAALVGLMYEVSKNHALQLRRWRGNEGCGAVYQGRYRASPVHNESYFYRAVRYVERNPVRAALCARVEEWPWSSASRVAETQGVFLADWPVPRPKNWLSFVNETEPKQDIEFIRQRTQRCEPIAEATDAVAVIATPVKRLGAVSEDD